MFETLRFAFLQKRFLQKQNVGNYNCMIELNQGRRQKNFQGGGGQRKKQDRKIVPLSFLLLHEYHV